MPARATRPASRPDDGLRGIAARRLYNLGLANPIAARPESIVETLGAVQSQDYAAARWALAIRTPNLTEEDVERAFDSGLILRTHVLRPTWHFVVPSKIHDLLALTAPRVHASNRGPYRQCEIDGATRIRSQKIMVRALEGGRHLTRAELGRVLERGGLPVDARRTTFLAMAAELDGVICSGPRRRGEFTYALLQERAPGRASSADCALEHLARRYFSSHGPATLRDFAWWSGLTVAHARQAVEMLGASTLVERVGEHTYYSTLPVARIHTTTRAAYLLPAFDEFIVAYRHRAAVPYAFAGATRPLPYLNPVVAAGRVVGTWARARRPREIALDVVLRRSLTRVERAAVEAIVKRFSAFAGMPARAAFRRFTEVPIRN